MKTVLEQLRAMDIDICDEAEDWIESHPDLDPQELWDICPRVDWMFYLIDRIGADIPYQEIGYEVAAHAVRFVKDPEIRNVCCHALDVLSQYIDGAATHAQLIAAEHAADVATRSVAGSSTESATRSAEAAIRGATRSVTGSATKSATKSAARSATEAAARFAAEDAAARSAAWATAEAAARSAQADIVRYFVPEIRLERKEK